MHLLQGEGNPGSATSIFMNSLFFAKFSCWDDRRRGRDLAYFGTPPGKRHDLVKRWTRNLDTTNKKSKIFVPVNSDNNHWYMIMIDLENKKVLSMDSLRIDREDAREEMLGWIEAEHKAKRKPFEISEWTHAMKKVPKQNNGYDCGPFACLYAAFMSNDKNLTFLQGDIPKMRRRIAWSILNTTLL